MLPENAPVIVGTGEVNDRPAAGALALNSADLMLAALKAADTDAGGGLLARCDRLFVVQQNSDRDIDVPQVLSAALGLAPHRICQMEASGDLPIRYLNMAANAIGAGEAEVCFVTGGEARRSALKRQTAEQVSGHPFLAGQDRVPDLRHRYGLSYPAQIYPLFENATRALWGQSLREGQEETGEIWSHMAQVAERSDGAWMRRACSPDEIISVTPDNRKIAFPYTKLMAANASVNQGAAFVVTSLAAARRAGIAEDRLIHVGAGAAAHEADDPLARHDWGIPPAMRIVLERTMQLNGLSAPDLDHVELYSCFPCMPKMARRVLDWPRDRPVTVHGGMTFGGGPGANYMSHAVSAMVRILRRRGRHGLLFANGGFCTHNHAILLSRVPTGGRFPQDYDFQAEADAGRGAIPVLRDDHEGLSMIETYTVVYDRQGAPAYGVVLSRTEDGGDRVVSHVDGKDAATIAFLTDGRREPVGAPGVTSLSEGKLHFRVGPET